MSRPDWPGQADPCREGKIKDILCSGYVANRFVSGRMILVDKNLVLFQV